MKIAILHYHFDRGGVSRVVSSTLEGFADRPEFSFALLSGRPFEGFSAPTSTLPGLDYTSSAQTAPDPDTLHREVVQAARRLFNGTDPDVWHIHNPALGKNAAFCGLVARLARDGRALLLHEHDFAEDFRPANFHLRESTRDPADAPFPFSSRVRFAVLNQRDAAILTAAGLPSDSLVRLPNPIPASRELAPPDDAADVILYPVRALARKNIGEFLLLSHASKPGWRWQTTLPPTNPRYRPRFEEWCALAGELSLPVQLGVAASGNQSLEERFSQSRAIVTTSVAEGFGLGFLEPWTHGRPVFGRDLPEITGELRAIGIPLDRLYEQFPIPAEAIEFATVAEVWLAAIRSTYHSFATIAPDEVLRRMVDEIISSRAVDFSILSEDLQMAALRRIVRQGISVAAPTTPPSLSPSAISDVRQQILSAFNLRAYTEYLAAVYEDLAAADADPPESLPHEKILQEFLDPSRFHPHFAA